LKLIVLLVEQAVPILERLLADLRKAWDMRGKSHSLKLMVFRCLSPTAAAGVRGRIRVYLFPDCVLGFSAYRVCTKWNISSSSCNKLVTTFKFGTELMKRSFPIKNKVTNKMIEPVNSNTQNVKARCPDCDAELDVPEDTEKGEILSCPGCGLELEVKQVKGGCVDLQELTIEGEDWGE